MHENEREMKGLKKGLKGQMDKVKGRRDRKRVKKGQYEVF